MGVRGCVKYVTFWRGQGKFTLCSRQSSPPRGRPPLLYRVLADVVLATHFAFVLFVVLGLVLILAGGVRAWAWVRNPWFRMAHLVAIGVVVAQAWLGVLCPLTSLEAALRERAGEATYAGSFVAHWLARLLYFDAPPWVFTVAYTLFAALVAAAWLLVRPRPFRRRTRPTL